MFPERRGTLYATGMSGSVLVDAKRRRVRLIECQYRKPARAQSVTEGPFRGAREKRLPGEVQ